MQPMLAAFYAKISEDRHGGASKLKSDATYFTIADGVVQHLFIEHLFTGGKFAQIVGEEDESSINILTKPYMVDDLVIPEQFNSIIEATLVKIKALSSRLDSEAYKTLTVPPSLHGPLLCWAGSQHPILQQLSRGVVVHHHRYSCGPRLVCHLLLTFDEPSSTVRSGFFLSAPGARWESRCLLTPSTARGSLPRPAESM